jgi:2,4-dienoyl-CoA reductase-like NADH-dependent reductase (Old Yellow Enzyme family)
VTLGAPVTIGSRSAPSRVVFGPHETNLGDERRLSERHVAYYARRAQGGAGVVVVETASVEPSDWPYERAPLAAECGPRWAAIAEACAAPGTLVLAGIGHTGLEGSSAYSQEVLWGPSRVADVVTREPPAEMEQEQIDTVVSGFTVAARVAMGAGMAGVEVDAGPRSLLRQFLSGLTNLRGDGYGSDRGAAPVMRRAGPVGGYHPGAGFGRGRGVGSLR